MPSDLRRRTAALVVTPDFAKFWLGQALANLAGKSITLLIPLVAVVALNAGPTEVGLINSAQFLPLLIFTLFAGAWLSGRAHRPTMITANAVNAVLLALVPLAMAFHWLDIYLLYVVVFSIGAITCFADVCALAYAPVLVVGDRLVTANSRLETTYALATVAAPGLGGILLGTLGGSTSLALGVAAYLLAVGAFLTIRHRAVPAAPAAGASQGPGIFQLIGQGLRFSWRVPLLRRLTLQAAWFNLFEQAVLTLYLVYAVRDLDFSPGLLGLTMTIGGAGSVLGSLFATRLGTSFGAARTLIIGMGLASVAPLVIPLVSGPKALTATVCTAAFVLYGLGLTVFNIFSLTARQRTTPDDLLAPASATNRFVAFGTIGIGAALGGWAGTWLGLQTALVLATVGLVAGWLVFAVSLVRSGSDGEGGRHEDPAAVPDEPRPVVAAAVAAADGA
ncbi:MFS transporter [Kitasatospora sp. NPDC094011]|uniref:MFS transporter n=1 Tax=Kitasatospora sp. NPDC094011 TaxID=3364090 RepID=UPI00380F3A9E